MRRNLYLFLFILLMGCGTTPETVEEIDNASNFSTSIPSGTLSKNDFEYLGAFRLPIVSENEKGGRFGSSGSVLAFKADGDPNGADDGYPGSLYTVGHIDHKVGEIDIPKPVMSAEQNLDGLPIANFLSGFAEVTDGKGKAIEKSGWVLQGLYFYKEKLHYTIHPYYNTSYDHIAGHGFRSALLEDDGSVQGACFLGSDEPDLYHSEAFHSSKTAGYLFEAPESFCKEHLDGKCMIAGLTGAAGQAASSWGPSMFAFDPMQFGDSLSTNCVFDTLPLLYYPLDNNSKTNTHKMPGFTEADRHKAGSRICTKTKCGVVFVGSISRGELFYGPSEEVEGACDTGKGYHAPPYEPVMLFFNPTDFIQTKNGALQPWEVNYYEEWVMEDVFPTCRGHLSGLAYDSTNQLLYLHQPGVDNSRTTLEKLPIIHVFRVKD